MLNVELDFQRKPKRPGAKESIKFSLIFSLIAFVLCLLSNFEFYFINFGVVFILLMFFCYFDEV